MIYIFFLSCSKSKNICLTFFIKFRDFMKILSKCHLRFFFIVFTSIVDLLVNSVYTSYTILFEILVEVLKSEVLDDFRLNYYN